MPVSHQLILCTCPDKESAEKLATELVSHQLAACVNILPNLTSIYRWLDTIEIAQEQLMLIKANKSLYPDIEALIRQNHPYQTPEIIAVAIENGLLEYLQWIDSCHLKK
ncbi:MAG: divalent-cation tolerance protein CutA [Methylococcaceae bacterium]|jgi:periplasmic divalent cation tolerance protein